MTEPDLNIVLPEWASLKEAARIAREKAYAPYSQFRVGAAVLTDNSQIYQGCNVENASYGLTICAERVAVCSAVAAGLTRLKAICISLSDMAVPCGACRQFLNEFHPEMWVLCDQVVDDAIDDRPPQLFRLSQLLPHAFRFGGSTR
ncbi:MAG: cytidine deaminase [Planctomycetaceae bacterium]|nr:cytidine deaminase [Planctomycetaceae bacterium]